ncbi:MAG: succinyl-diaminopimelate desuccinylase, partial [Pseudomonadota bacterium]
DEDAWTFPPFAGIQKDGVLWGRGAVDMKSGVAAFVSAACQFVGETPPAGSIALLITGDEEGPATDGTVAILEWMKRNGETADFCLVGEPTSAGTIGDVVKIGRRGSMTGHLTVTGAQGHTAYPERAINPLPILARVCTDLAETPLDLGSTHFQPSTLALTTIDVGNPANNVIPQVGTAVFNIRFNDQHTSDSIKVWVNQIAERICSNSGASWDVDWTVSGESFLTEPGPLTEIPVDVITDHVLERPALTTGGGTSDARFIKDLCPVLEFGLVGDTMHQIDERVPEADIRKLAAIYLDMLRRFFGG